MGVRLEQVADHHRRLGARDDDGSLGADTETLPALAVGRCWLWTTSTATATMVVTVTVTVTITRAKKTVMMMMMTTKEKTN